MEKVSEHEVDVVKQIEWEIVFITAFQHFAKMAHENAKDKGWWYDLNRNDGELICLMHSELSEALEALRNGDVQDDHIPEFRGVEAELADTIIRIMDYGTARGLRIPEAIIAKMEYNKNRPFKHGGKEF